ncbi:MAG: hypothetical protein A2X64_05590 [Ignavibacteria bacterium GWF2_33_9]|nr:MAG: hypothetical protein A2X64_05590 [Ignavibacteria bacterium GWF2_33_9]
MSEFLISCGALTREERDIFSITDRDTTYTNFVKNSPNNMDNGVIFPSSREILVERNTTQHDSEFIRYYPDFIRFGIFESIGTIGGASSDAIGTGLFGVFPINELNPEYSGDSSKVFSGGIYRLGISEWRLRWFRDAPNWTIGTSFTEAILPDANSDKYLISFFPIYIRKRFFLREEIPYIALTPAIGVGYYPSQYINASVSLDLGSIGGLNLRTYLGFAAGYNGTNTPQMINSSGSNSETVVFPYAGLGISFLDFLNLVPETYVEWKDHQHSAWEISVVDFTLLGADANKSIFKDTLSGFLKGFDLQFARTNLAIPLLNNRFYVGTSLLRLAIMGRYEWAMGILPIRFGYWHTLIDDELTTNPFMEFAFYPSSYFNIGAELNLRITQSIVLGAKLGYITGNSDNIINQNILKTYGQSTDFSNMYFGISLGFQRIFFENDLRYNRPELPLKPKVYE